MRYLGTCIYGCEHYLHFQTVGHGRSHTVSAILCLDSALQLGTSRFFVMPVRNRIFFLRTRFNMPCDTYHNGGRRHLNMPSIIGNTMFYKFLEVPISNLDLDIAYMTVFFLLVFPQVLQANSGILPLRVMVASRLVLSNSSSTNKHNINYYTQANKLTALYRRPYLLKISGFQSGVVEVFALLMCYAT